MWFSSVLGVCATWVCIAWGEVDLPKAIEFDFLRNIFVARRMGLFDHLVTIRVLEHPWGPTQWLPGVCSLRHGGRKCRKHEPPPFLCLKSSIFWVFFYYEPKSVSGSRLHGVCMGRSGTSAREVYALSSHFCCFVVFGDLGERAVSTLSGASRDVMIVYTKQDTKGRILQSLALLRPGINLYQRREMTASTNNGSQE